MQVTQTAVKDSGGSAGRTLTLRRFGLVMAAALGLLAALLLWKQRPAGPYALGLAGLFALTGVAAPRLLGPVERAWMVFAGWLSVVMTYVVLTLAFFLVITPIALLRRIFSRDPLRLRREKGVASYWVPVDPDGPAGRHDRPY